MTRAFFVFWLLIAPISAFAAAEPVIETELPEGEIIVGQPATLRITVLVPTWMPKPPAWPTLEVPGMMVRLPERASTAVSRTIGGETWSGVSRAYRLYPLEARTYQISAQKMTLIYANPDNPAETITATPALGPFSFAASLPPGAGDLNPPIVAGGFELEQQLEAPEAFEVGGAVTRTVTARIDGTTPVLIPSLIPEPDAGPLRAYPNEPVVTETEQRGDFSGARTETVTYVAQAGGSATLPAISVDWFNLGSGKVETAVIDAVDLTIAEPAPPPPDFRDYLRIGVLVVAASIAAVLGWRIFWPRVRGLYRKVRNAWQNSEPYAARGVRRALHRGSLAQIYGALDLWLRFSPDAHAIEPVLDEVAAIGATAFGRKPDPDDGAPRRRALAAFSAVRSRTRTRTRELRRPGRLPPLNP